MKPIVVVLVLFACVLAGPAWAEKCPEGDVMTDMVGCMPLPSYKAGKAYKTPADLQMRLAREIMVSLIGVEDRASREAARKAIDAAVDAYVAAMAKVPGERKEISVTTNPVTLGAPAKLTPIIEHWQPGPQDQVPAK